MELKLHLAILTIYHLHNIRNVAKNPSVFYFWLEFKKTPKNSGIFMPLLDNSSEPTSPPT